MKNIFKPFPILASLSAEKQKEIVEQARSETFRIKGNSGKWARSFVGALLIGFGVAVVSRLAFSNLFDLNSLWVNGIASALGFVLMFYIYQSSYIKLLTPKVDEIAGA